MVFHLDIEWLCLREFWRLARRDPRYLGLILTMYGHTLDALARSQMLRATYCLARLLDDVLDGDCLVAAEPETYVQRVLQQARSGCFTTESIASRLGRFVFQNLDRFACQEDQPLQEFIILIEAMLFDRERARQRLLLTQKELYTHHRRTFGAALNVALCIGGADTRAPDIPDLIQAQGCLYTLRDLDQDLSRGLVNIPLGVVEEARRQGVDDGAYEALRYAPVVQLWMRQDLAYGAQCVARAGDALNANRDRRAVMVLRPLYRGLRHLVKRLPRDVRCPASLLNGSVL
jgi:hypothetical protein